MMISILLVDDHSNIRRGLRKILVQLPNVEVVGETGDGKSALDLTEKLQPDVMLLDVEMPGMKGYEVARTMMENGSSTRVIAVSGYNEKHYIMGMFASGAVGYLTKDEAPDVLKEAVEQIAQGKKGWLSPKAAQALGVTMRPRGQNTIPSLTPTEKKILKLMNMGKTDQVIALEMKTSVKVVMDCIKSILVKLDAQSRMEAIVRGIQEDLV